MITLFYGGDVNIGRTMNYLSAIISLKDLGGLKLVGYRVPPECRIMTEIKMLYVETYWTIDEPLDKNYLLSIRGKW